MINNPHLFRLILIVILLMLSAFFSACEAAFFSLHDVQFETLRQKNKKRGELIRTLLQKPRRLLVTIYIGNEIVNVGLVAMITSLTFHLLGESGLMPAMVISLALLLLFGEITPKTYAIRNSERLAFLAAIPLKWFTTLVYPLQFTLTAIANFFVTSLGIKNLSAEPIVSKEEIRTIIDMSEENGDLPADEKEMIQSVFDLRDTAVSGVMTPRTDIFAIEISESKDTVLDKISKNLYSRIPVYENSIDNIVGIFYVKDLMHYGGVSSKMPEISKLLRPSFMIPESKKVNEMLNDFLKKKVHLAIVLDEHGGVAGLVTLEDLLEELFGEIEGEYRKDEKEIIQVDKNNFKISARTEIKDFNEKFNATIPSIDFDTVGGYIFHAIGRVPRIGETVNNGVYHFTVEKMRKHRIVGVLLHISEEPCPAEK